jgi:hypothetical protein
MELPFPTAEPERCAMNGFPRRLLLILLLTVFLAAAGPAAISADGLAPPSPEPGAQSDDPAVLKQELKKARMVIHQQEAALIALRKENEALKKRFNAMERLLAPKILSPHFLPDSPGLDHPENRVEGRVLAVTGEGDKSMVELSIGSDQGLKAGHRFEVYRLDDANSLYLGQVEVVAITPDRSTAKVVQMKGPIKRGDRSADKLSP